MSINNPNPSSASASPRFRVVSNGAELPALGVEINSVGNYHSDTFHSDMLLRSDPAHDLKWWGAQTAVPIEVQFGFDGDQGQVGWTTLFQGEVDTIDSVQLERGILSCSGRDLTRRLIDAKTQEAFQNQTSSQIAATLATRRGLQSVITPTKTLAARYYSLDHDHITLGQFHKTQTEWDLLVFLAQREGFDVFVDGLTLHFQPRAALGANPYTVQWRPPDPYPVSNVSALRLTRALTLANDIIVKVTSWRSSEARNYTATAKSSAPKKANSTVPNQAQTFVYTFPNLTKSEAQSRANNILADLSKHERVIEFDAPGDLVPTPRTLIQLDGTGSSWDQTYYVDEVKRTLGWDSGFAMHVRAKNHSPQNQVQVT